MSSVVASCIVVLLTYITQAYTDIIEGALITKGEIEQFVKIHLGLSLSLRVEEPPDLVGNKPASTGENELKYQHYMMSSLGFSMFYRRPSLFDRTSVYISEHLLFISQSVMNKINLIHVKSTLMKTMMLRFQRNKVFIKIEKVVWCGVCLILILTLPII